MKIKTQKITNRKFNKRVYIEMNNIIIIKKKKYGPLYYTMHLYYLCIYTHTHRHISL